MQKKIIASLNQTEPSQSTLTMLDIILCLYGPEIPHDFKVLLQSEIKTILVKTLKELIETTKDDLKMSRLASEFLENEAMKVSHCILQELISLIAAQNKLEEASQIIHSLYIVSRDPKNSTSIQTA